MGRKKRFAQAVLGAALLLPMTASGPGPAAARPGLTQNFNARSNGAPAYDPKPWNDASDDKISTFYDGHQDQLGKIAAKEGRLYIWPLSQILYKNTDAQLHAKYGLTLAEAKEFRAAFTTMAGGMQLSNNCYSYALNHPGNPPGWKLSPGEKAGLGIARKDEFDPKDLTRLVKADGLLPAGQEPVAKKGYYLVAMFVIPGDDFHFVRQNEDGSWSHKPGDEEVTNMDFKGRPITDPRKASMDDYQFVSYFYVPEGGLKFNHPMHQPPAKTKHAPAHPKQP